MRLQSLNVAVIVLVGVLALLSTSMAQADVVNIIVTDFEEFTVGDNTTVVSEALSGVTITADPASSWQVFEVPAPFGERISGQAFGDFDGGSVETLRFEFDQLQDGILFNFGTRDAGTAPITVTGYRDNEFVGAQNYTGTYLDADDAEGRVNFGDAIDELRIATNADNLAIDMIETQRRRLGGPFVPGDDRLNRQPGAPVAIYCTSLDSIGVYDVDEEGRGIAILDVQAETLYSVPATPQQNTVIQENNGYILWRLPSREYMVETPPDAEGKIYLFVFNLCPPTVTRTFIEDTRTGVTQMIEENFY
jgi:hypothetical protein